METDDDNPATNSLEIRVGSYGTVLCVGITLFSDGPSCRGLQIEAACSVTECKYAMGEYHTVS
jgi:hypothetical protein